MPNREQAFPASTVSEFSDALNSAAYDPVPGSAWIAVTDVAGSTQAIAEGRYKDVNLAGAAGIAAFSNAFPTLSLPFTFGGDGAAVLVPAGAEHKAREVLGALQSTAQSALGLKLRTALVPIGAAREAGADVRILYQSFAGGRTLPMMCGGGLSYAENLLKTAEGHAFHVPPNADAPPPNLEGLSCRWQPIKPQRGIMLSVLVQGPPLPDRYLPVFDALARAAAGPQSPLTKPPNPIWPPQSLWAESGLQKSQGRWRHMAATLGQSALGVLSTATGWTIGGFNGRAYRDSLARHCDALKFADGLKMVIDCSNEEADAVTAALDAIPTNSGFAFGLQRSDSALMTCYVQTTADTGHIHFIDGAQGGYAIAARNLKERAAAALTPD